MDAAFRVKLQNLTSNPGYIITRPLATSSVQAKKGEGTRFIDNAVKLESVEVLVGNGNDRPRGVPKISTGDLVYIKSDRYTQPWARERITTASLDEVIDGKTVLLQFIRVPIDEVVMISGSFVPFDYTEWVKTCSPDCSKFPKVDGYPPYFPGQPYWPSLPPAIYGDPPSSPNVWGNNHPPVCSIPLDASTNLDCPSLSKTQ